MNAALAKKTLHCINVLVMTDIRYAKMTLGGHCSEHKFLDCIVSDKDWG